MSFNRDNIVWKSEAGTWSIGFYRCYPTGDTSSEDYDPEWDVDYDLGSFEWASTGHRSEQAAIDSWDGPNPGMFTTATDPAQSPRLDAMVEALRARAAR